MPLFILDIHWHRPTPHPDKPSTGHSTVTVRARDLIDAAMAANTHFTRQHGPNLVIDRITEKQDPAGDQASALIGVLPMRRAEAPSPGTTSGESAPLPENDPVDSTKPAP